MEEMEDMKEVEEAGEDTEETVELIADDYFWLLQYSWQTMIVNDSFAQVYTPT